MDGIRLDVPVRPDVEDPDQRIALDIEALLVPSESIWNPEIDDDEDGIERVAWKVVSDELAREFEPGVWFDPDIPALWTELAPADDKLEFTLATALPLGTRLFRRAPRTDGSTDEIRDIGPVDSGDDIARFYRVTREWLRGDDGWAGLIGAYPVRRVLDFGADRGSMTVDFCLTVSPIRVRPTLRPEQTLSCQRTLVES